MRLDHLLSKEQVAAVHHFWWWARGSLLAVSSACVRRRLLMGGTLTIAICVGRLGVQYSCPFGGGVERAGVVGVGCGCAVGCLRERAVACCLSRPADACTAWVVSGLAGVWCRLWVCCLRSA